MCAGLAACGGGDTPSATPAPDQAAPVTVNAPAGEYHIDKSHATLVFRVLHMGLSHYTASFSDMDATLQFDPDAPASMQVEATINVRSLTIPSPPEGFYDTLMGDAWMMADQFPTISFVSKSVTSTGPRTATVDGELTLFGVTRPVQMTAEYVGGYPGFHPHDPQARIGFSAYGVINRSDFGMIQFLPTETSPGALSDAIEFRIDAEFLGPPTPPEITEMDYNQ